MNFASVNGIVVPAEQARVSVLDNGFAFGDSVLRGDAHLRPQPLRARASLPQAARVGGALGFEIPHSDAELLGQVDALVAKSESGESYVRIVVSRGVGDCSYDFSRIERPDRRDDPEAAARVSRPALREGHPPRGGRRPPQPPRAHSIPRSSRATCSTTSWRCARRRRAAATSRLLLNQDGFLAEGREHEPLHRLGGGAR
jgi:branched-subunit amino acid aminotransferase/4-amino-4-deoxychorismate lyase